MSPDPLRRRAFLAGLGALGLAAACGPPPGPAVLDVRSFGARGDGATKDTRAIQAALDAAAGAGGGTVVIPAGRFLSGSLVLGSRTTLHLAAGAVLLGSRDIADYPAHPFPARDLDVGGFQVWALLYAEGAERIAVEGAGVVDGQGDAFPRVPPRDPAVATSPRPRMVFFTGCRDVALRDVTLRESGIWTVHLARCSAVRVSGLRVTSTVELNQDGIVLDSCRDAVVADCTVSTVDDGIVLKSSFPEPCQDVTVTRCDVASFCAAMKLGTQSLGGFRRVVISDCRFHDCRLGGVKLQTVDGGDLVDVTVRDITMTDVGAPLSIRRGARGFDYGFADVVRPRPVGALRDVRVSGLRATITGDPTGTTMSIAGLPGFPVEGVTLDGVDVTVPGGGTPAEAARTGIPELPAAYPEHTMFGVLPASGLWVRHARDVTLRDVRATTTSPDARPALVTEDVVDLRVTGSPPGGG